MGHGVGSLLLATSSSQSFDLIVKVDHLHSHHLMDATQVLGGLVAYEGSPLVGGPYVKKLPARLTVFIFARTSVSRSIAYGSLLAVTKAFFGVLLTICRCGATPLFLRALYSSLELTRRGVKPSV